MFQQSTSCFFGETMSHFEPSHESIMNPMFFFLRLLQAAASGVDIIRGRHFGDSLLGSFAEMRFEPPSREEVHSTCGTHTHTYPLNQELALVGTWFES